ncbi:unnamed protein product [Clonostachys byssicola]|uniref:F-box domain-containing protein n=1 Tax=Clonostachys byssicola TaxID=160290 RepID=A0A9N9Y1E4_9HYPO|nr:unnamed protein product [Clonostachys byssicola]
MEPASLLNIPTEIQTKIFLYLVTPFGPTSNIQAVLRTCRQLYEVALPVSVSVFRNTPSYPKDQGPCSRARNIKFLRLILINKPWLAKHVGTVIFGRFSTLEGQTKYPENWVNDPCPVSDYELGIFQHHIEYILGQLPTTLEWSHQWTYDLQVGSSDAQVVLILLVCPNIRTLLYEMPRMSYHLGRLFNFTRIMANSSYYFGSEWINKEYSEMTVPLRNLQDVYHEILDEEVYQPFSNETSCLFGFPKLRFYECIGSQATYHAAEGFMEMEPRSSSVEEIVLHWSWSTAKFLQNMLGACRALKKLEFSHRSTSSSANMMMPRDILDAISPHANTFEHLYLNLEDNLDKKWDWTSQPERLYMGTGLRHMHALKRLTIGMQELTGMLASKPWNSDQIEATHQVPLRVEGAPRIVDCLPDNLEYLMIHSCGGKPIIDQIQELVHAIAQGHRLNNLRYLGMIFHDWRSDFDEVTDYLEEFPDFEKDMQIIEIQKGVRVDIGKQSITGYHHDLLSTFRESSDRPSNIMSRIYAPNYRDLYLERRMNPRYMDGEYGYEGVLNPFEQ